MGRRRWNLPEREATPEPVYFGRRDFLKQLAIGAGALLIPRRSFGGRNPKFVLDRPITDEKVAGTYNNYYEFTTDKEGVAELSRTLTLRPWTVEVGGLCQRPRTWDIDALLRAMPIEERLYRHRCVEAWSMAVPWTGFPLHKLIALAEPMASAKFVRLVSVKRPAEMLGMRTQSWYPWPYFEALTLAEAMNELTFAVTGIYGHALSPQHGAPLRLAVPWKYGYKSPKAIVKIELTATQPPTFWNALAPAEYGFESNVNPKVPHPRWSQATERLIGTGQRRPTLLYNGYGEWVAGLYKG